MGMEEGLIELGEDERVVEGEEETAATDASRASLAAARCRLRSVLLNSCASESLFLSSSDGYNPSSISSGRSELDGRLKSAGRGIML